MCLYVYIHQHIDLYAGILTVVSSVVGYRRIGTVHGVRHAVSRPGLPVVRETRPREADSWSDIVDSWLRAAATV